MERILIGTYTRKTSEGIYTVLLNTKEGKLETPELLIKAQSPTYLEYNKNNHKLYSVYQNDDLGGIAIYDYQGNEIKLDNTIAELGSSPCFVHYDHKHNRLLDANYHLGKVNVYQDNKLEEVIQYEEGAHAHYVHTHPKTGHLYTIDLGNDKVYKYDGLDELAVYHAKENSGPRHLAFHPHANYIYIFTEYSNELIVLKDEDTFEEVQVIYALPEEMKSDGAAVRISQDGKYVYVSSRGHDSITVFEVNDDYTVTIVQNISTEGNHPRDFNLSLSEDYLVVANRDSDNLVLYRRNANTGLLELISKDTHVPEGVNVVFIKA